VFADTGSVAKDFEKPNRVVFGFSSGSVCLRMITDAQLLRFVGVGAMKSFTAEKKESEADPNGPARAVVTAVAAYRTVPPSAPASHTSPSANL
jgi:hypothetical protein